MCCIEKCYIPYIGSNQCLECKNHINDDESIGYAKFSLSQDDQNKCIYKDI